MESMRKSIEIWLLTKHLIYKIKANRIFKQFNFKTKKSNSKLLHVKQIMNFHKVRQAKIMMQMKLKIKPKLLRLYDAFKQDKLNNLRMN